MKKQTETGSSAKSSAKIAERRVDEKPSLTVIIPVYNEEKYLRRCLDSIVRQTEQPDEVIIIDDGSTDGSLEIIKDYCATLGWKYKSKINGGVSVARNVGLELSTSDYITFLDSDDEYFISAIASMKKAIKKYPDEDIIQFNHLRYYAKIDKTVQKYDNRAGVHDITSIDPNDKHYCNFWMTVWNKVFKYNPERFDEDLKYGEDAEYVLSHLLNGNNIRCIDELTVIHHFENLNSLTKQKTNNDIDKLIAVYRYILEINIKDEWPIVKALVANIEEIEKVRRKCNTM